MQFRKSGKSGSAGIPTTGSGIFQDSCHSLVDFYAAFSVGLSGFNVTAPIALQS
jgi:hypothetical protein